MGGVLEDKIRKMEWWLDLKKEVVRWIRRSE